MTKILVHSSLIYSLVNFRGELLKAMVAEGHEVIVTAPDRDPRVEAKLAEMGIRFEQVPMARASLSPFTDLRTLASYLRLMWKHRPDVVIAYTQKPIIYGGMIARLFPGTHFHVIMSGLGFAFSPAADHRRFLRRLVSLMYRLGVARAKTIFVFNADDKTDMVKHGIITRRHNVVQVPGSGVDTTHFTAGPPGLSPPVVLLVARLMRDKGIFEFVESARRVKRLIPDARFQILGRRETDNPTGISDRQCREWSAEGIVDILPETHDVRPHLNAATLFVLPSYYREGLPRTILEALASGRPVITTDMPGCRDAIIDNVNGRLVPPRDPASLADAISELLSDPILLERMSAAARETAVSQYDVRDVNRKVLRATGLMDRPGPDAPPMGLNYAAITPLVENTAPRHSHG